MKTDAIVYTSCTGNTYQYAQLLGQALALPVCSLEEAILQYPRGSTAVYLGCIHANCIKNFRKAHRHFNLCAVCGVGLCDTGTMTDEVRKATAIPNQIALFTLQGGINRSKLKGMNKLIINMLIKGLSDQKQRSAQDERILELLTTDGCYVSADNLGDVLSWYKCSQEQ